MLLRSPSWHTSFFISCTFALDSINNIWLICISLLYLSETVPLFLDFFSFFFLFYLPSFLYSILVCVLLRVLLCVLRCVLLYTFFGVMLTFSTFFLSFLILFFPSLLLHLLTFHHSQFHSFPSPPFPSLLSSLPLSLSLVFLYIFSNLPQSPHLSGEINALKNQIPTMQPGMESFPLGEEVNTSV